MLALFVAVALELGVQQPPARPMTPPRDATGTTTGTAVIRGRVFAADTKKPLRRARIIVSSPELGQDRRQTSTNIDGRYEAKELPAGRYTVLVQRSGYLPLRYGQRRPLEPPKPLQIADGERVDNIDFTLPRMSVITGRVFDETSDPVAGAEVYAMRTTWYQGRRRLVPAGSTGLSQTDDAGQFRISGLTPGTYFVRANLRDTWTVTENGVEQTYGYAPTYHPTTTSAADARRVLVGVGQEVANADVFLIPGRAVSVSGTAFDSRGRPMTGQVGLNVETRGPEGGSFMGGPSGRINADGTFAIKNVPPGEYAIHANVRGDSGNEAISMPITVGDSDVDNMALVAAPGWSFSGHVVADDGASPRFGPDRARLVAKLVDGDRDPRIGGFNPDSGRVKDDWSFTVTNNYAPSRVRVTLPDGWALKAILDRDGHDITDDAIDLRKGEEMTDVRVVVTSNVTAVSGQLSDDKGQPIVDGTVIIFAEQADKWSEESRFIKSARLDQQGQYEIKGLPPSAYLAVALDYVEDGIWNDPEFLESLRRYGTKLTLAEGEARSVPLKITALTAQQ